MGLKPSLPIAYSSDWHQIMAKALYVRLANAMGGIPNIEGRLTFTREELENAAAAEFGYDLDDDGGLIFQPMPDDADANGARGMPRV